MDLFRCAEVDKAVSPVDLRELAEGCGLGKVDFVDVAGQRVRRRHGGGEVLHSRNDVGAYVSRLWPRAITSCASLVAISKSIQDRRRSCIPMHRILSLEGILKQQSHASKRIATCSPPPVFGHPLSWSFMLAWSSPVMLLPRDERDTSLRGSNLCRALVWQVAPTPLQF